MVRRHPLSPEYARQGGDICARSRCLMSRPGEVGSCRPCPPHPTRPWRARQRRAPREQGAVYHGRRRTRSGVRGECVTIVVDRSSCHWCGTCVEVCPVGALRVVPPGACTVDADACVECRACVRGGVCANGALSAVADPWPRSLRQLFSDPLVEHAATGVPGRGTEEMKTNDVTARFGAGEVGLLLDVGRPGLGARLADVELLTVALAAEGLRVETCNPTSALVADPATGRLRPDVLDERVLSLVLEYTVPLARLATVLACLRRACATLPTVCSVGLVSLVGPDDGLPVLPALAALGLEVSANAKVNLGFGAPARPRQVP